MGGTLWLASSFLPKTKDGVSVRDYELVLLVSPRVADEEVPAVIERVTKFVTERGGTMGEVKPWGRRRMAYHIKDFEEANYVQALFKMEPKDAKELDSTLNLSEDVVRHLLVKNEA